jgi:hypothetical protein
MFRASRISDISIDGTLFKVSRLEKSSAQTMHSNSVIGYWLSAQIVADNNAGNITGAHKWKCDLPGWVFLSFIGGPSTLEARVAFGDCIIIPGRPSLVHNPGASGGKTEIYGFIFLSKRLLRGKFAAVKTLFVFPHDHRERDPQRVFT